MTVLDSLNMVLMAICQTIENEKSPARKAAAWVEMYRTYEWHFWQGAKPSEEVIDQIIRQACNGSGERMGLPPESFQKKYRDALSHQSIRSVMKWEMDAWLKRASEN